MAQSTEPRAVVTWAGAGEHIILTLYGAEGVVSIPMVPTRALELAKDLMEPAVTSIKVEQQWGAGWPG